VYYKSETRPTDSQVWNRLNNANKKATKFTRSPIFYNHARNRAREVQPTGDRTLRHTNN